MGANDVDTFIRENDIHLKIHIKSKACTIFTVGCFSTRHVQKTKNDITKAEHATEKLIMLFTIWEMQGIMGMYHSKAISRYKTKLLGAKVQPISLALFYN